MLGEINHWLRDDAPASLAAASEKYERRFALRFHTLSFFPLNTLADLHRSSAEGSTLPPEAQIASDIDPSILTDIEILTEVANLAQPAVADRQRYLACLIGTYRKLGILWGQYVDCKDSLYVAPEREGRILAELLGWLPSHRSLQPNMKRLAWNEGIAVGTDQIIISDRFSRCVIIDGAIASGCTVIALMHHLVAFVREFVVFSAHSTPSGLFAVSRFARTIERPVKLITGHCSGELNSSHYAVDEKSAKLIVGDLGDTIAELFA